MIITIKYQCNYRLKFAQNYVFSGDKCFNTKTNREIKQVYNNGSIGYNINGKFKSVKFLKTQLEKITVKSQRKPTHFSRGMNLVNNFVYIFGYVVTM